MQILSVASVDKNLFIIYNVVVEVYALGGVFT